MGFDIGRRLTREEEMLIQEVTGEMREFPDDARKKFEDMLSSAMEKKNVSEVEAIAKVISDISLCSNPQRVAPLVLSMLELLAVRTESAVEEGKRPVIFGPGPKGYPDGYKR